MRKKKDDLKSTYTTIYHDKRIELGLNLFEYAIVDTIYILSRNDKGYCYKSIRAIARDLGMSFDGVRKAIIRLLKDEKLIKCEGGYKAYDLFIQKAYRETDRLAVKSGLDDRKPVISSPTSDRSAVEVDRPAVATDRSVVSQQMLELQKNNKRNTYGSPREDTREPKQTKPPSAVTIMLQEQIERILTNGPTGD